MIASSHNARDEAAPNGAIALARLVLEIEAAAITALIPRLGDAFSEAVRLILQCRGRVVVSGVGKSGHIARKMASTFASTGTPAFFVHAAEASHGDLGMIRREDLLIALSYSGESDELTRIVPLVKRSGARMIAMSGHAQSTLARQADVFLDAHVDKEACPLNLAPTASTTAMLALGDALAVALLDARGFDSEDFARAHPGGALGRRLLTHVSDVMRTGDAVPAVPRGAALTDAILEISRKGLGMTAIVDADRRAIGVFTDGDLRRLLERQADLTGLAVDAVMSLNPRSIAPDRIAAEAVAIMEEHRISQRLVLDPGGVLVGALNMHDLCRAKVI